MQTLLARHRICDQHRTHNPINNGVAAKYTKYTEERGECAWLARLLSSTRQSP
jgi:hypothetical protein